MKCSLCFSNFFEEISNLSHSILFLVLCIDHLGRLSFLSLVFFGTLHSDGYIFPFLLCLFSFVRLFVTPACQAPLSLGFYRLEYWSDLPFLSPGELPEPGIKLTFPISPALQVDSLCAMLPGKPFQQYAAAAAKSLQSCPTLCNPRDGSPPGSPVPGILQARIVEWVAISLSNQ